MCVLPMEPLKYVTGARCLNRKQSKKHASAEETWTHRVTTIICCGKRAVVVVCGMMIKSCTNALVPLLLVTTLCRCLQGVCICGVWVSLRSGSVEGTYKGVVCYAHLFSRGRSCCCGLLLFLPSQWRWPPLTTLISSSVVVLAQSAYVRPAGASLYCQTLSNQHK